MLTIEIEYLQRSADRSVTISISPEEYFLPLEAGESFEADGQPRYTGAENYINIPPEELNWTEVRVRSTSEFDSTKRTQYERNGTIFLMHWQFNNGNESIIHTTEIDDSLAHVIRLYRSGNGPWKIHSDLVQSLSDGSVHALFSES